MLTDIRLTCTPYKNKSQQAQTEKKYDDLAVLVS